MAQDYDPQSPNRGVRWEGWLALTSWPSLSDLEPVAGGSFDDVGFGLGFAAYWPISQLENAEFMLGVEGAVMATDSDVPVIYDDLVARVFYAAVNDEEIFISPILGPDAGDLDGPLYVLQIGYRWR